MSEAAVPIDDSEPWLLRLAGWLAEVTLEAFEARLGPDGAHDCDDTSSSDERSAEDLHPGAIRASMQPWPSI